MEQRTIIVKTATENVEVTGDLVKFQGFDEFEFVVHPALENTKIWIVSESSSGLSLPQQYQCSDKKDAVTLAEITLTNINSQQLREIIRKAVVKAVYIKEN